MTKPRTDNRGVEYIGATSDADLPAGWAFCSICERAWNDAKSTAYTPTPAGRCPFEDDHEVLDPYEPIGPFSPSTEVTVEWESEARCYIQVDGHDLARLEFIEGLSMVNVRVWDRLTGELPDVAAEVEVAFNLEDQDG